MIDLYHGSTTIVEKPIFGFGKTYNDYGKGFYCARDVELAKEWGSNEGVDGFVNKYTLDQKGLKVLNLLDPQYHILNWLAILVDNRIVRLYSPIEKQGKEYLLKHFLPDYKQYDVIIGYRADDSYFSFVRNFLSNNISLNQLSYAMRLGKLGEQYVLISEKAFNQIQFVEYLPVFSKEYYPNRKSRDEKARSAFIKELEKNDINGLFIRDIILSQMENEDERLR